MDDIDDKAWQAFTVGGKIWGYPLAIEAIGLIYNKDLVPTPPKTFDEVIALDKKLSAQGKKAILWDYNNTYFTWPLLAANGGYAFKQKADGTYDPAKVGVNNAGALRAPRCWTKLIKEGVMPKGANYAAMEAGVRQGQDRDDDQRPLGLGQRSRRPSINFGVARIPSVGGKTAARSSACWAR